MKTELLLLLIIMTVSINAFPYLRKLDDETKTEAECKTLGKDFEEKEKAKCKVKDGESYEVKSQAECQKGTWNEAHCSTTSISDEGKCKGTPVYGEKCTITTESGDSIELTDRDSTNCAETLVWTKSSCSVSTVTEKNICAATTDLTFTAATGKCVDKKSDSDSDKNSDKSSSAASSFNSFLSFKFGLVLIIYLLF